MNYFTVNFVKILNHSLLAVESIHCNFQNVENSNCTFHIAENITRSFPHCGNYHCLFHKINYLNYLTVILRIVDHLEHFFHISTNRSAICQISSASMLAALAQYSISVCTKL